MTYFAWDSITEASHFHGASATVLVMYKTITYINSCVTIVSPFSVWLRRKALADCLQQMTTLEHVFHHSVGIKRNFKSMYIRLASVVFLIVSVTGCVTIYDFTQVPKESVSLMNIFSVTILIHYPLIVTLLLDLNFCVRAGYLRRKFRDLNRILPRLAENLFTSCCNKKRKIKGAKMVHKIDRAETAHSTRDVSDLLSEIRKAYSELCKLTRTVNYAFGIQNLLSMGISFVVVTGMLYTICRALSLGGLTYATVRNIISATLWSGIYILKILVISHICWRTGNEARRTGKLIYDLLESRVDKNLQNEIEAFSVQIIQHPIEFNAHGFFTLDFTLVQSMIASVSTYLVILLQLSPSNGQI
ncbi:gustatory and pheromone receptor 32a-like [Neodiprion fabricii]|uniref:gustatory and pheromone receptor 32a-like n=1 Tax=Neodiprion fabricii TaxID=2872261 RepID=UPI001ED91A68|nr:gustatory and pheromone receptor 32a-like [Neodiprion fabricii]